MLNIVICEDNVVQLENSSIYLNKKIFDNDLHAEIIYLSDNYDKMDDFISNSQADLYILDINLNDKQNRTGLDLAKKIREISQDPYILFTTVYADYMKYAFSVKAFDFLIKPFDLDFLWEKFLEIYKEFNSKLPKHVFIKSGSIDYKVDLSSILYVEKTAHREIRVVTIDNNYTSNMTLTEIEELPNNIFLTRVHKSYLVNLNRIKSINYKTNEIVMENGYVCNFGKNHKENIERLLKHNE